jgi:hypothetical protein
MAKLYKKYYKAQNYKTSDLQLYTALKYRIWSELLSEPN